MDRRGIRRIVGLLTGFSLVGLMTSAYLYAEPWYTGQEAAAGRNVIFFVIGGAVLSTLLGMLRRMN